MTVAALLAGLRVGVRQRLLVVQPLVLQQGSVLFQEFLNFCGLPLLLLLELPQQLFEVPFEVPGDVGDAIDSRGLVDLLLVLAYLHPEAVLLLAVVRVLAGRGNRSRVVDKQLQGRNRPGLQVLCQEQISQVVVVLYVPEVDEGLQQPLLINFLWLPLRLKKRGAAPPEVVLCAFFSGVLFLGAVFVSSDIPSEEKGPPLLHACQLLLEVLSDILSVCVGGELDEGDDEEVGGNVLVPDPGQSLGVLLVVRLMLAVLLVLEVGLVNDAQDLELVEGAGVQVGSSDRPDLGPLPDKLKQGLQVFFAGAGEVLVHLDVGQTVLHLEGLRLDVVQLHMLPAHPRPVLGYHDRVHLLAPLHLQHPFLQLHVLAVALVREDEDEEREALLLALLQLLLDDVPDVVDGHPHVHHSLVELLDDCYFAPVDGYRLPPRPPLPVNVANSYLPAAAREDVR